MPEPSGVTAINASSRRHDAERANTSRGSRAPRNPWAYLPHHHHHLHPRDFHAGAELFAAPSQRPTNTSLPGLVLQQSSNRVVFCSSHPAIHLVELQCLAVCGNFVFVQANSGRTFKRVARTVTGSVAGSGGACLSACRTSPTACMDESAVHPQHHRDLRTRRLLLTAYTWAGLVA